MSDLRVALTFDAEHPSRSGGDAAAPARVLDALAAAGVHGTFFVQGRWASAHPALALRIAEEGHLVGNHSNYHAPMTLLSAEGVRTDVREAERRIVQATGIDPRPRFRCPFGDGADRSDIADGLAGLGYRNVPWDLDSGDWREGATQDGIEAVVVAGVRGPSPASVVLFHTWPAATAAVLPRLLERLAHDGTTFVVPQEVDDGA